MSQTKEQRRAWLEERKRKGLCLQCDADAVVGKTLCEPCATKYTGLNRDRTIRYKAGGRCVSCGASSRLGKTQCSECAEKQRLYEIIRQTDDPRHRMVHSAKSRAKLKGLPFSLSPTDFEIPATCPVLGIPIKVGTLKQGRSSPTLDRIIPALGYVKGNVCVISWRANDLRRDASVEELEAVARYARWAEDQASWLNPNVPPEQIREAMEAPTPFDGPPPTTLQLLAPLD